MRLIRNGYLVGYKIQTTDTELNKGIEKKRRGTVRTKKKEKRYKKHEFHDEDTDY